MNADFLTPVKDSVVAHSVLLPPNSLGAIMRVHTQINGFPDLKGINIAILGVEEDRNTEDNLGSGKDLHHIRRHLYQLFPGNWNTSIADLGNIKKGDSTTDTHFAVTKVIADLLKLNIIPIIIGGGQDTTFSNYKAYDALEQTVNLVAVDSMFDLGNFEDELSSKSYLSKIIMEVPSNLFNYSNIGYQTYFNSQEEINLIQGLNFDAYKLGQAKDLEIVEPVFRDADIVSIDIGAVRQSDAPANNNVSPNGFYGEEICAISRYAGISSKVSSFSLFEITDFTDSKSGAMLLAQVLWYFIEGVNFRVSDDDFTDQKNFTTYKVPIDDEVLIFKKSNKTGRWWIELPFISNINNKLKSPTLLPCTYGEYLSATNQEIPERWLKARRKNEV